MVNAADRVPDNAQGKPCALSFAQLFSRLIPDDWCYVSEASPPLSSCARAADLVPL